MTGKREASNRRRRRLVMNIVGLSLGLCVGFIAIGATMRDPNSLVLAIVAAACFDQWRKPCP